MSRGKILEGRRNKMMKHGKRETVTRFVLSLICFTAYIALCIAVTASALNTSPYSFLRS
jgi:hypothetical protein